uniref:Putative PD-(D/E)XK nuclease superfamily protein n=1 Tax=viral metagenome TaxID=1070528 RepID=A0A6M3KEF6_9ZZZZ
MMEIKPQTVLDLRKQGIYVYDWSNAIHTFLSCPLSYNYKVELGLVRKDTEPSSSLIFGQCLHVALDVWYSDNKNDALAVRKFIELFKDHEEKPKINKKSGKETTATYTTIYGCSLLTAYFNKYRNDTRAIVKTEIAVAEELEPGIYYGGRIDKLLTEPRFVDYKSTKYPNNLRLNPNPQFLGYKFLINKLTGKNVPGEVDILPVTKSKDPTDDMNRSPFDFTLYQLENWRKSTVYHIKHITKCRQENYWPQTWNCDPYFSECPYVPLCTLTQEASLMPLMQSMYNVQHWDFMSPMD